MRSDCEQSGREEKMTLSFSRQQKLSLLEIQNDLSRDHCFEKSYRLTTCKHACNKWTLRREEPN